MKLDQDKVNYLSSLLGIAKALAEHGTLPRINQQVMEEIKAFDVEGSLEPDGETDNG